MFASNQLEETGIKIRGENSRSRSTLPNTWIYDLWQYQRLGEIRAGYKYVLCWDILLVTNHIHGGAVMGCNGAEKFILSSEHKAEEERREKQ